MAQEQADFAEVLKEAQKLGYAEADPTLDIKGFDAAHKISLLAAIARNAAPAFAKMEIEGIDEITLSDINLAAELGYKIKLLGIYKNLGKTHQCSMYPALVAKDSKIAQVDGPFNAAVLNASNASWNMFIGRGAGGLTTGSAVVADLVDVAMNRQNFLFGAKVDDLIDLALEPLIHRVGGYFLRLKVNKNLAQKSSQGGDLATQIFGEKIDVQKAAFFDLGEEILCGFLTKSCLESDLVEAFKNVDPSLVLSKKFIRVETIDF
jgi:homoserine dehydrogenase